MERIQNAFTLNPLTINLSDIELEPPRQTENGVSLNVKFRLSLMLTAKTTVIGAIGGGVIGGAGGVGVGVYTKQNVADYAIKGIKWGLGIGAILGGLVGVKSSYDRVIVTSARINNFVHPPRESEEYSAAKRKGTEILKAYFKELSPQDDIEEMFCPITQDLMKFPVKAQDGITYEYEAIAEWIGLHPNGVDSSPMRIRPIALEGMEYGENVANDIGRKIVQLSTKLKEISGMNRQDLNEQFRSLFAGQSLDAGEINDVVAHDVVKKLIDGGLMLTPAEIKCLNIVTQPFVKLIKDRHDAVFTTTTTMLSTHLTEGRISIEKHTELSQSLVKWYTDNKVA